MPQNRHGAPLQEHLRRILIRWTEYVGIAAAVAGTASTFLDGRIRSAGLREAIHRLGGGDSWRDALVSAELSVGAIAVTAFDVAVLVVTAESEERERRLTRPRMRNFFQGTLLALAGSAWLLLIVGVMYTVGVMSAGGSATPDYVLSAINHAPAVWTIVAMTAVAWSFRPTWARAGWILWAAFAVVEQFGRLLALPPWIVGFSPYSRIASMPAERFDSTSTIALTAGCCVLLMVAVYNRLHRDHAP